MRDVCVYDIRKIALFCSVPQAASFHKAFASFVLPVRTTPRVAVLLLIKKASFCLMSSTRTKLIASFLFAY